MDGDATGWHVLCTSDENETTYGGFGLESFYSTAQVIFTHFAAEFNKKYIPITDLLPEDIANKRKKKTYSEFSETEVTQNRANCFNC